MNFGVIGGEMGLEYRDCAPLMRRRSSLRST